MADLDGRDPLPGTLTRQQGASGLNFDAAYEGSPPWDIGAPQPDLAELAQGAALKGRVLDVSCGTGEHALLAAERGFEATGIDTSPMAIAIARVKARDRGLTVRFLVGDALDLGAPGEQFDTVIASGLFHVFDDEQHTRYAGSLRPASALGGHLLLPCFSDRMRGEFGPRRVSKEELYVSFAEGWRLDSIDEARMIVTFAPDGAFGWRTVLTRVN